MKTLIIILIIAAFLQTTVIPTDLVMLILICRAYLKTDRANLFLAFTFGILTGHLNLGSLGITSLIYLLAVGATQVLSKVRLAANPLLIIPISFVFLSLGHFGAWELPKIVFGSFLSLPFFYAVRGWEERFIAHKDIKLKI